MAKHKFAVGQSVRFTGNGMNRLGARDGYTVTRILPAEGADLEYRIKSPHEPHERVVRESQLERPDAREH